MWPWFHSLLASLFGSGRTRGLVLSLVTVPRKVISESNEAIVHSGYEGGSRSCFCCCREEPPERTNSASNLDPYRRRPLPPIAGSEYGKNIRGRRIFEGPNGAPEVLVSTRRLDPLKGMTNPQDPSLGIYITSIQGCFNCKLLRFRFVHVATGETRTGNCRGSDDPRAQRRLPTSSPDNNSIADLH